jgi:hypothetical protein
MQSKSQGDLFYFVEFRKVVARRKSSTRMVKYHSGDVVSNWNVLAEILDLASPEQQAAHKVIDRAVDVAKQKNAHQQTRHCKAVSA